MLTNPFLPPASPATTKSKFASVRLTAGQDRLLRQHCIQHGMSAQQVIISGLVNVIEEFDKA